jgi:hypothetical protein
MQVLVCVGALVVSVSVLVDAVAIHSHHQNLACNREYKFCA